MFAYSIIEYCSYSVIYRKYCIIFVHRNIEVSPDGIELDMEPVIGNIQQATVIIEKNDNAEGIIQFAEDSGSFIGKNSTRITVYFF